MFEKFTSNNADDFRQRYEGTFGFYKDEKGSRLLSQLIGIRNDVCIFVDKRGVEYRLFPDTEKNIGFEFIPPKASFYNTPDGAMLVQRVAARQFQRGLTSKNTMIYLLSGYLHQQRVSFANLEKVYMQEVSPAEAYAKWDSINSVAVSKQIALDKPTGAVYMFEKQIGSFTKAGNHFIAALYDSSLWGGELRDALRKIGCTVEVTG